MGQITDAVDAAFKEFSRTGDMFTLLRRLCHYADLNIRSEQNYGIFEDRIEFWEEVL